jgi:hypothetical protein
MPNNAQDTLDRINATANRIDALSDVAYERAKRDIRRWRNDDREAESWRRDQMRKDAEIAASIKPALMKYFARMARKRQRRWAMRLPAISRPSRTAPKWTALSADKSHWSSAL